ncbi:uncharacterized protein FA14DRAFT_179990 [Meira miltonrushii]|uniref:Uncharacterized protein n=1 Tax=Meira miltonrushii TaxID=1280837 RepID=A0A316V727_9BASI|nr:uncharacterized protein FA14DRAFT_179990 [Meira miltonrushii]PWN33336.1 hypothetical protein FA14DRAFT_179990 [Meira miltonrushii]
MVSGSTRQTGLLEIINDDKETPFLKRTDEEEHHADQVDSANKTPIPNTGKKARVKMSKEEQKKRASERSRAYHKSLTRKGLQEAKRTLSEEAYMKLENSAKNRSRKHSEACKRSYQKMKLRLASGEATTSDLERVRKETQRHTDAKQKSSKRRLEAVQQKSTEAIRIQRLRTDLEIRNTNKAVFAQLSPPRSFKD